MHGPTVSKHVPRLLTNLHMLVQRSLRCACARHTLRIRTPSRTCIRNYEMYSVSVTCTYSTYWQWSTSSITHLSLKCQNRLVGFGKFSNSKFVCCTFFFFLLFFQTLMSVKVMTFIAVMRMHSALTQREVSPASATLAM